jgi:hypothetical protein
MTRATFRFAGDAAVRGMAAIAAESAPLLAEPAAGGAPSDRPVFIIGVPRSGTTLVEQILASHSETHGAGELTVMARPPSPPDPAVCR